MTGSPLHTAGRYLRLMQVQLRMSTIGAMQYRADFIVKGLIALFWPGVTCAYHLPASTAPIGTTSAGLPIGVQIVGPLYGDRTTIHVAGLLERHWRQFVPPPGWE